MADDFTYIVSRLNALDAAMPDEGWYARLAKAEADSLLGSLREYFKGFEQVESIEEFEIALQAERASILDLVSKNVTEEDTLVFLLGEYDFDNLLYLWKIMRLHQQEEPGVPERTVPYGLFPVEALKEALNEGTGVNLPPHLKVVFEKLSGLDDESPLVRARHLCESEKWKCLIEKAPGSPAEHYTRCRIDLENVKTFIRVKRTGLHGEPEDRLWIKGGEIDAMSLDALLDGAEEDFYSYLRTSRYDLMTRRGLESGTPLWKIDLLLSEQLFGCLSNSRYRYFDIGPVLYHIEKRKNTEALLRSIIIGVINKLPEDLVFETFESILRV